MSGSENLTLNDLGEVFLDSGREAAIEQAERTISSILDGELSFMDMETPEVAVEDPDKDSEYHARYLALEDRIEFSPSISGDSPDLRETSIHELFHKHQDVQYFGFSESNISYNEAVDQAVSTINSSKSENSGILNRIKESIGWKSKDEKIGQEMFLKDSIGHEGALPALFTVYSSKYSSEIPDFGKEIENHYSKWKEAQEDRSTYKLLVANAKHGFDTSEVISTDSRQVMKIEEHEKAAVNSTDEKEIRTHLQAIDEILDENGISYQSPANFTGDTLTENVDAEELAQYNQATQEALERVRESVIGRIDEKDDLQNPVPKYFQEAFAHAASMIATGIIGDPESEQEYWKNKVERPYNFNLSYRQEAGTKAREIGEQVIEEVRSLETEEEMYRQLVEIQDRKVEDYRITV